MPEVDLQGLDMVGGHRESDHALCFFRARVRQVRQDFASTLVSMSVRVNPGSSVRSGNSRISTYGIEDAIARRAAAALAPLADSASAPAYRLWRVIIIGEPRYSRRRWRSIG